MTNLDASVFLVFHALMQIVKSLPICDIVSSTDVNTVISNWKCISNLPETDICCWPGVNCQRNEINSIDLSYYSLSGCKHCVLLCFGKVMLILGLGTLPNSIGDISALSFLNLEESSFYGILLNYCAIIFYHVIVCIYNRSNTKYYL